MNQHEGGDRKGRACAGAFASFFVLLATAAQAAEEPNSNISLSGQGVLVSDYVWRGLSQTWGKPAAQILLSVNHKSGAYASFFASNVAAQFVPNGTLELNFGAGYKTSVGELELDAGAVYVLYPGANFDKASFTPPFASSDPRTLELSLAATWSSINARVGYVPTKFYGWNINNSGVSGVFNSERPATGLTGDSSGAVNVEATYTYTVNEHVNVQATLGRQIIPNSIGINWSYGRMTVTASMSSGWSLSVAASGTTNPEAFRSYGSLTNNGQRSTPSRSVLILALSKQV